MREKIQQREILPPDQQMRITIEDLAGPESKDGQKMWYTEPVGTEVSLSGFVVRYEGDQDINWAWVTGTRHGRLDGLAPAVRDDQGQYHVDRHFPPFRTGEQYEGDQLKRAEREARTPLYRDARQQSLGKLAVS